MSDGGAPVAVVTGATGGIGAAICRAFAADGFRVVVGFHRSPDAATALLAGLEGSGHVASALPVTDSAALRAAAERLGADLGRVDVLVNCAGTTRFVAHPDLDALDDELFDLVMATNVRGPFAAVRAFRSSLDASDLPGGGVVVNISSSAAVIAMGSNVAYCASKAALDNMTRSLARALAPRIRVVSVSPGLVDTEFVQSLDPAWRDEQVARTPLGHLATPDDVARSVVATVTVHTVSTGAVFGVDGGRPLA